MILRLVFRSFILLVTISFSANLLACDVCGSASGNSIFGIIPQFTKGFMALHYQQQTFKHPANNPNMSGDSKLLSDKFQLLELRGRHYLDQKNRWQLQYSVPYRQNTREESNRSTTISGIGDITVAANYALVNTGDSQNIKWKNTLLVGGTGTIPSGKYQQRYENLTMMPPEFQVGSGAWSGGILSNYTTRLNNIGLNIFAQYVWRATNELDYSFGNAQTLSAIFFYWINTKKAVIMPNAGVNIGNADKDTQYGNAVEHTGGTVLNLNIGADIYFDRFFMNVFVNNPLATNIPAAQPIPQSAVGIRLGIFLGSKSTPQSGDLQPSNFPQKEL